MLSHNNLLHNQGVIQEVFSHNAGTILVSWLPLFHDMGLSTNVLQSLFCGGLSVFFAPAAFLQHPLRWLTAISRYRGTSSSAPNFAYELCARKVTTAEKGSLDLSSWKVAVNGAEPVRSDTLDRFVRAFESCGITRRVFFPCYGLAEATLIVSGTRVSEVPTTRSFHRELLQKGRASEVNDDTGQTLVAVGKPCPGETIFVVDGDGKVFDEGVTGEIWVASASVAQGYWNDTEATDKTFQARLADGRGPFLRTGDLGFFYKGELYVTGRLKDVIIIRGRKHYPQDLEDTIERSHPALRLNAGAVFSVDASGEERLIVVHELEARRSPEADYSEVFGNIQQAMGAAHGLQICVTVLLKPGAIPRTSSGKIQRSFCKQRFLQGGLTEVARFGRLPPMENAPPIFQ
jgi:acyl-CoA synthetase (AMP-forming)/AMP-acid ligase II